MSYRSEADNAVLQALKLAYTLNGDNPVKISQVMDAGEQISWEDVPRSEIGYRPFGIQGGHTPFSFNDRTQRYLRRLVKQGKAFEEREDRSWVYTPLEGVEEGFAGETLFRGAVAGKDPRLDEIYMMHGQLGRGFEAIKSGALSDEEKRDLLNYWASIDLKPSKHTLDSWAEDEVRHSLDYEDRKKRKESEGYSFD